MNALERALAVISPRWAAERAFYRSVMDVRDVEMRSYNAAKAGRRGDGWAAVPTSANAELGMFTAARIRDRARDLVRNNPYAAGYPGLMASKIIGSGIQPRLALTGATNRDKRAKARDIWDRFADNCDPEGQTDFYGLQSLVARTVAESGEAIIRTIRLPAGEAPFPLQIAVLEGDYLDSSRNLILDNGHIVIQGVQYDTRGRRVAYWLFDHHPGDTLIRYTTKTLSKPVDAADIDHVFERLRPGQARGVSPFAAVAMKMRDLDDYDDAELMRKKVSACFAAFVRPPAGNATSPLVAKTPDDTGRMIEKLSPAMIKYLRPGEEVTLANPPVGDAYTDYHFGQLYAVAAGLGCTFEQLTGNLKGVNFSSMRVGENRFQDLLDHLQWHVYIPQMCRRAWDRVGQVARITGDLGLKDPWVARWIPPRRRWLDPKTDVDANITAVRGLLKSAPDAIAESGYDPEEVLEETQEFNRELDARGIISDIDPRRVGKTSAAAPVQPAPAADA